MKKCGQRSGFTSGFTIVELLIVVVVIAILAAITIVSYNGITAHAKESVAAAEVATLAKKIEIYKADHGVYPSLIALATDLEEILVESGFYANTRYGEVGAEKSFIFCEADPTNDFAIVAWQPVMKAATSGGVPLIYYSSHTPGGNAVYPVEALTTDVGLVACEQVVPGFNKNDKVNYRARWSFDVPTAKAP